MACAQAFEHELLPFSPTARELRLLERLNASEGRELLRPVISGGQVRLKATQHVGLLWLGRRVIHILPKTHREDLPPEQAARDASRNLLQLLSYAPELELLRDAAAQTLHQEQDWFEALVRIFASNLLREVRAGPARAYEAFDEELPTLKGKWRIADQLRRPEMAHRFAVTHDLFTSDNALNRVFRFVVDRLEGLTRSAGNRRLLSELGDLLGEVRLMPHMRPADAGEGLINRLNRRFAPLLSLARLFLAGRSPQLSGGADDAYVFLFDMNRLFESFVAGFLMRHRRAILPPELADCEIVRQAKGCSLALARAQGRDVFHLRPDLALRAPDGRFAVVIDTKYKRLDPADRKLGIAEGDFYQMFAYAHRYEPRSTIMLYPRLRSMIEPQDARFELLGAEAQIWVASLDIGHDLSNAMGRSVLYNELSSVLAAACGSAHTV